MEKRFQARPLLFSYRLFLILKSSKKEREREREREREIAVKTNKLIRTETEIVACEIRSAL